MICVILALFGVTIAVSDSLVENSAGEELLFGDINRLDLSYIRQTLYCEIRRHLFYVDYNGDWRPLIDSRVSACRRTNPTTKLLTGQLVDHTVSRRCRSSHTIRILHVGIGVDIPFDSGCLFDLSAYLSFHICLADLRRGNKLSGNHRTYSRR